MVAAGCGQNPARRRAHPEVRAHQCRIGHAAASGAAHGAGDHDSMVAALLGQRGRVGRGVWQLFAAGVNADHSTPAEPVLDQLVMDAAEARVSPRVRIVPLDTQVVRQRRIPVVRPHSAHVRGAVAVTRHTDVRNVPVPERHLGVLEPVDRVVGVDSAPHEPRSRSNAAHSEVVVASGDDRRHRSPVTQFRRQALRVQVPAGSDVDVVDQVLMRIVDGMVDDEHRHTLPHSLCPDRFGVDAETAGTARPQIALTP